MRFSYRIFRQDGSQEDFCTRFEQAENLTKKLNYIRIEVVDNETKNRKYWINSKDDLQAERDMLERMQWIGKKEPVKMTVEESIACTNKLTLGELSGKDFNKEKAKEASSPKHHKGCFVMGDISLEWLEAQQHHRRFSDPEKFKAAVELQVRKYLDRNGGKDSELQEVLKSLWYLKFLAAYIKNDNKPIRVADIDKILSS